MWSRFAKSTVPSGFVRPSIVMSPWATRIRFPSSVPPDSVPVRFTGVTTRLSGPKCCHPAPMLYVLTTEPGSASSFAFSETTDAPVARSRTETNHWADA